MNLDSVTTKLYIENNFILTSPDNSIFETLNKFVHAKEIDFNGNNITEIPSNAFNNTELKTLKLGGSDALNIKKLGKNVFSRLKNLELLSIQWTSIDFIPENAFEFNEKSDKRLTINIQNNPLLNSSSFSKNSLSKFKRPITIQIEIVHIHKNNPEFSFLDQKVFLPFLKSRADNNLILDGLKCSDCRNYWLQKNPDLLKQIKIIFDQPCSSFIACPNQAIFDQVQFENDLDSNSSNSGNDLKRPLLMLLINFALAIISYYSGSKKQIKIN